MAYIKKTYRFHGSNEMEFSYKGKYGAKGEKRQKKKKATPEQIKRQNQWQREKRMRRLMKENFRPGDLWCTLKYPRGTRKPVGEVMKDFQNFTGRLRRQYRKYGEKLKFIYRLEIGARGGIHIHLLVNRIEGNLKKKSTGEKESVPPEKPPDTSLVIQEAWKPCGRIHYEPVYSEGLFQNLACYMTKQPDEAVEKQLSLFPEEDRKKLIKTGSSRNLIRPEPETKEYGHWTMRKILEEGPKPTPGFYIDPDSIVCGVNPVTGMSYLQYIEYALFDWQQEIDTNTRDPGGGQKPKKRDKTGIRQAAGGDKMNKKSVNIYIATSITGPRRGPGVYMYLLECFRANGETVTRQQAVELEDTTENELALSALEAALGRLTAECYLTVYTDCEYLYRSIKNGLLKRWSEQGWMNSKYEPVKYVNKWTHIQDLLNAQDFHLKLKEDHGYKKWMASEIKKKMS